MVVQSEEVGPLKCPIVLNSIASTRTTAGTERRHAMRLLPKFMAHANNSIERAALKRFIDRHEVSNAEILAALFLRLRILLRACKELLHLFHL